MKTALAAMALVTGITTTAGASHPALRLVQTVPLPGVAGRFDHFAADTKGRRLFVAALGNNTLEVIDLAAGARLKSVPGMSKPQGVLYLPALQQIVVANGGDGTVKFLSGTDYRVLHTLTGFEDADNVRLNPATQRVWVGYGDGALAEIDPLKPEPLARVTLPAHPESFQIEPGGSRLFVNLPEAHQVAVLAPATHAVTGHWPMEKFHANFPMALDEANGRVFVGCRRPPRLLVLDAKTGQSVADLPLSGDTDDLFFDATRKRIYVSCGEGFIDCLQQTGPDHYELLLKLPTREGARTSYFSPELGHLYLAVPQRGSHDAELGVYTPQ